MLIHGVDKVNDRCKNTTFFLNFDIFFKKNDIFLLALFFRKLCSSYKLLNNRLMCCLFRKN